MSEYLSYEQEECPGKKGITMHCQDFQIKVVQLRGWLSAIVGMLMPFELLNGLSPEQYYKKWIKYQYFEGLLNRKKANFPLISFQYIIFGTIIYICKMEVNSSIFYRLCPFVFTPNLLSFVLMDVVILVDMFELRTIELYFIALYFNPCIYKPLIIKDENSL